MKKIIKYLKILKCYNCENGDIIQNKEILTCKNCNYKIEILDKKLIFTKDYFNTNTWAEKSKSFKTLNDGKYLINKINGPKIKDLPDIFSDKKVAVNLGSGENNYDNYINIDLGNYKNVDIICDLENTPFKNSSISLVCCNSVFEHLKNPISVKNEVKRILKPGGIFYLCVPFMCIRHHEIDFRRWTSLGLEEFIKDDFDILDIGVCRSPAHGLISYMHSFIDLSVNNKFIKKIFFVLWKYLSAPLYLLKVTNSQQSMALAQTIYIIGKKK
jgi:SAM-dependent methyltransferase